ncbi:hypothetical protein CSC67_07850 [Pusillimonas caeni]|uniref:hypothetical protein n=1 Tax=Pusillimonas caeni TaxID=1348472 RepID=UPI000E59FEBD|nr:hypothetical protein [Pusillimonas caeni]TFL14071.1 hypothetical protein CSC67_07850 [Pusillimonas caeni]
MDNSPFKPFWPAEKVGVGDNPKLLDLGKPDAEAAQLAEKLQNAQMSFLFSRVALFIGNWIVRPFIWWPLKLLGLSWLKMMAVSTDSKKKYDVNEERRRQAKLGGYDI